MRIYRKVGDRVELMALGRDLDLERGEYVLASDGNSTLVLQVIDVEYADVPGTLEETLRDLTSDTLGGLIRYDPMDVESHVRAIRDSRLVITKLRKVIGCPSISLPSRYGTKVRKASPHEIIGTQPRARETLVQIGEEVLIDPRDVEGSVTIITGRKESGKSHLAKLLATSLATIGYVVLVFDLNGEYVSLGVTKDGGQSYVNNRLITLSPGVDYLIPLSKVSQEVLADVMTFALGLPQTSLRELLRACRDARERGRLSFRSLHRVVSTAPMNESVRDAILNRLSTLEASGLFSDEATLDEKLLEALSTEDGRLVVLDMSCLSSLQRRILVEYVLSCLREKLFSGELDPLILFAEEAHLYLRETYWEDVVTRMRHIGISTVLITNQPDSIPALIYRQADNVFAFNLRNGSDIEHLARNLDVDAETLRAILPNLEKGQVLVWGKAFSYLPMTFRVLDSCLLTRGETRRRIVRKEGAATSG
ncbi:MAG: ATP-binding protein [Thaumarchaeota archaeon]|nr:ATP-binding protein [Candidatus Calditenuaceae archaeon]MDW8042163.1 ATP-binding protein [Nitrososphaerota archaeon]